MRPRDTPRQANRESALKSRTRRVERPISFATGNNAPGATLTRDLPSILLSALDTLCIFPQLLDMLLPSIVCCPSNQLLLPIENRIKSETAIAGYKIRRHDIDIISWWIVNSKEVYFIFPVPAHGIVSRVLDSAPTFVGQTSFTLPTRLNLYFEESCASINY